MDKHRLIETVNALVAGNKGLLAMDESITTCNKRFEAIGIPQTADARRNWRELIATTPGLGECISGVILFDETIRQQKEDGGLIVKTIINAGIVPGIKVDNGAVAMSGHSGEKITEGLDGLRSRLIEYAAMGARFAKWRSVITIGKDTPSNGCIEANAHALARYASICQDEGFVPVVEPEVLMEGGHDLQRCADVTAEVLHHVFNQLYRQGVLLEGMILKPNMVIAGLSCRHQPVPDEVADATVTCFLRSVPAAVGGIAFLSGGQTSEQATVRLNAMHKKSGLNLPWPLTFSFARAIQEPAIHIWAGKSKNVAEAQHELYDRAACNQAALLGKYNSGEDYLSFKDG